MPDMLSAFHQDKTYHNAHKHKTLTIMIKDREVNDRGQGSKFLVAGNRLLANALLNKYMQCIKIICNETHKY